MKVYDCFAFFNELDIAELRMQELDPLVDHFVIVEATRTFQKKEKPLFFQQNRDRFSRFENKIIYIKVDKFPTFWSRLRPVTTWHYDNHQKEQAMLGLGKASSEDQIIFSDLDEIPSAQSLSLALSDNMKIKVFEHFQAHFYINNICLRINDFGGKAIAQQNKNGFGRWRGSVLQQKKHITTLRKMRDMRDVETPDTSVVENGGWHLSNMGGFENVLYKMKSWAHKEYNRPEFSSPEVVVDNILNGRDLLKTGEKYELIPLSDERIPFLKTLKNSPENWHHMIKTKEQLRAEAEKFLKTV